MTDRFDEFAALPEDSMNPALGALLIAAEEYPELDVAGYFARFDTLAAGAGAAVASHSAPVARAAALAEFLFRRQRFRGNRENYYDPRNSYLNDVLDRRLGIPITLSLVFMETGRRLGLEIGGVGLPGHFVCRVESADGHAVFFDCFNGGRILTGEGCARMVHETCGPGTAVFAEQFLPVSPRLLLLRMLGNLKAIARHRLDTKRLLRLLDRSIALDPSAIPDLRERAQLHFDAGRLNAAMVDLATCLAAMPDQGDRDEIAQLLDYISARLRQFN